MLDEEKKKMVEYAYSTVPFYRKLLDEKGIGLDELMDSFSWEQIPIVEKDIIAVQPDQLLFERRIAQLYTGKLVRTHTSGTTGSFFDIYWNPSDYQRALLPLWMKRLRKYKIHPKDKVCIFNTSLKQGKQYDMREHMLIVSKTGLDKGGMADIYHIIEQYQPKWMILHPSMALYLCDRILEGQFPKVAGLTYIELTGEMVLDSWKKKIGEVFGCEVACHYGTMEVATIGYEQNGRYELFDTSTYVEVLDDEGRCVKDGCEGNIYVTSLQNRTMPIVRYGVGDCGKIIIVKEKDKFVRYLELTKARKNDWVVLTTGEKIPPDVLLQPIEIFNSKNDNAIHQFQVVQKSRELLEFHVVLDEEFEQNYFIRFYCNFFREEWGAQMKKEFIFHSTIQPCVETGKLKWFISEV